MVGERLKGSYRGHIDDAPCFSLGHRWHKGKREINQGGDVEHDLLVFPFRGERVKASIGAKTSIIHQQINRNTQCSRSSINLLCSAFAAEISRDDVGTNAVLFR